MTIYSDTLHWSDISLNHDLVTELNLISDFYIITTVQEVSIEHLQQVKPTKDAYSSGHLVLTLLGLAFVIILRPFYPELVMFSDFEFRSPYGTSTLPFFMFRWISRLPEIHSTHSARSQTSENSLSIEWENDISDNSRSYMVANWGHTVFFSTIFCALLQSYLK